MLRYVPFYVLLSAAVAVTLPVEAGSARPSSVLVEREGCGVPFASVVSRPAVPYPVGSETGWHETISVVVPPVAVVEFDEAGNVVSAMTNTGCAPRSSDLFYRRLDSGDLELAGSVDWVWSGDFTVPGVYVSQDAS